jgi:hypothetical protein
VAAKASPRSIPHPRKAAPERADSAPAPANRPAWVTPVVGPPTAIAPIPQHLEARWQALPREQVLREQTDYLREVGFLGPNQHLKPRDVFSALPSLAEGGVSLSDTWVDPRTGVTLFAPSYSIAASRPREKLFDRVKRELPADPRPRQWLEIAIGITEAIANQLFDATPFGELRRRIRHLAPHLSNEDRDLVVNQIRIDQRKEHDAVVAAELERVRAAAAAEKAAAAEEMRVKREAAKRAEREANAAAIGEAVKRAMQSPADHEEGGKHNERGSGRHGHKTGKDEIKKFLAARRAAKSPTRIADTLKWANESARVAARGWELKESTLRRWERDLDAETPS